MITGGHFPMGKLPGNKLTLLPLNVQVKNAAIPHLLAASSWNGA